MCREIQPRPAEIRRVLDLAGRRLLDTARSTPRLRYPTIGDGAGDWLSGSPGSWTSGFFPGSLWLAYARNHDGRLLDDARAWTTGLAAQAADTSSHDVGFKIFTSFGNGYRLAHQRGYRRIILRAARSLASRYSAAVGAIRSWGSRASARHFKVIVDSLMNLELLFWAAKHGGDPRFLVLAHRHALTVADRFIRADGSVIHLVDFDPATGAVKATANPQGYNARSVWSRGEAWAIAGFTIAFRETRDKRLLLAAQRSAAWFVNHLPEGCVPNWDFEASASPRPPKDSSAAAIAADGLLELSTLDPVRQRAAGWRRDAGEILSGLIASDLVRRGEAVLAHGTPNAPGGRSDVPTSYGDYYFEQALVRWDGSSTS